MVHSSVWAKKWKVNIRDSFYDEWLGYKIQWICIIYFSLMQNYTHRGYNFIPPNK